MGDFVLISDPKVVSIPVEDCGERLQDLRSVSQLKVDGRKRQLSDAFAHLRLGVVERLERAAGLLPSDLRLLIIEGYRTPSVQSHFFEEYKCELAGLHPTWGSDELHHAASRYIAPPDAAPHTAGAAVDLTLCTMAGEELDMGTAVNATPEQSANACYTDADNIDASARANRDLLSGVLKQVGLVNYPTEWWHWSFGDRYWAMTTGAPAAIYGPLDLD